jgi:hypothetical protein
MDCSDGAADFFYCEERPMPPLLLAQGQTGNDALSMFVLLLCVIFAVFAL